MFAHPLDLIMIYEDNICSNVPSQSPLSVLYLINVSELEMARQHPDLARDCQD